MRKFFLKIHLYGGLVTCWYLIIFGWSSLGFNHKWLLPEAEPEPKTWERVLDVPAMSGDTPLAERVRNSLGLAGWTLPWTMTRNAAGALSFEVSRPGRKYAILYHPREQRAQVTERKTGLGTVIHFLHGSGSGVPNSAWSKTWVIYTEITTWVVLFALISGAYLWLGRLRSRRSAAALVALAGAGSLCLICYILNVG